MEQRNVGDALQDTRCRVGLKSNVHTLSQHKHKIGMANIVRLPIRQVNS